MPKFAEVREIPWGHLDIGLFDEFDFFWINDTDFYDPDGYFFKNGRDEFGGYYNNDLEYVSSEEYKEECDKIREVLWVEELI